MPSIDPLSDQPVHLSETETGERVLIYATSSGPQIEIRFEGDALWMTRAQIAQLFGRDVSVVGRHVTAILDEGELPEEGNVHFLHIAQSAKPVAAYSLDMIISVGYRVSSAQATLFRRWATSVLVRFAAKGFVIDAERLKGPENQDRIRELRELIRDIRTSEANLYAELRRICSMCQDYDPRSEAARAFYTKTQAKLFYAVVNHTPSEIVARRADATAPEMGLRTWPKDEIRQQDALVAKNYLGPAEITELNRLTTILLDIFEDQLDIGKLTTMAEAGELLDNQLKGLNRLVLTHGGKMSHPGGRTTGQGAISGLRSAAQGRPDRGDQRRTCCP